MKDGRDVANLVEYKDNKFSIHSRSSQSERRTFILEHIRQGLSENQGDYP